MREEREGKRDEGWKRTNQRFGFQRTVIEGDPPVGQVSVVMVGMVSVAATQTRTLGDTSEIASE